MASITFATSEFAPVALGFFGLGTGYLILGPQELFGWPKDGGQALARSNGVWGFFMPGLCQALVGLYLFIGLTWFEVFKEPQLYAAAVAFSVFGIHWLAMGIIKFVQGDARPNGFMSIAFFLVSVLGILSFSIGGDAPVAVLFVGLAAVYFFEFFASFDIAVPASEKALGLAHVVTGFYLMYLTYGVVLSMANDVNILF